MNKEQREALQALADVMQEHDARIELGVDADFFRETSVMGLYVKDSELIENSVVINSELIKELLQEQE